MLNKAWTPGKSSNLINVLYREGFSYNLIHCSIYRVGLNNK